MFNRRAFFVTSAGALLARGAATLTSKQRVDRALAGQDVDRSPFSYWYHFLDETKPPEQHATSTLAFHQKFRTDVVKVMSDYPYPKPAGEWFRLRVEQNPFPRQIRALELIRDGVKGQAHILETAFNPYNVAEKLSSKEAVAKLRVEKPQQLLDALETIAKSEANHARRAVAAGASGIFIAIANSDDPGYAKFSEPFDKMVLDAVKTAPLNVLHIHGDKVDLPRFYTGWSAAAINYSAHGTKIPIAEVRKHYSGVILGGIDEVNYRKLTAADLKRQHSEAMRAAGKKYILTPGCSVPNETTDEEMLRLTRYLGA
jgi:uroporphyrinogen decarboxylase